MVSIRKAKQGFHLRRPGRRESGVLSASQVDKEKVALLAGGMTVGVLLIVMYHSLGLGGGDYYDSGGRLPPSLRNTHPHPHLNMMSSPMGDNFNAIALDILEVLDCANLFNATINGNKDDYSFGERRRLDEQANNQHGDDGGFLDPPPGGGGGADIEGADTPGDDRFGRDDVQPDGEDQEENPWDDLGGGDGGDYGNFIDVTAKHLFCVAAYEHHAPSEITDNLQCDAEGSKRKTLLDLWSAARAQLPAPLLLKVLDLAKEKPSQLLLDKMYHLWAPEADEGLTYMISTLNEEKNADNGGLHGLHENLGAGKLFVDVGSCLGLTTLAITQLYPGTKIVSIEPAQPNWLLQELNLRCNLESDEMRKVHVVLAGVGPNTEDEDNLMAKAMWRPTATTSTRAWTPISEHGVDDIELVLKLRRLSSVLAEANAYNQNMDVLNVDCEGCEYNLIPSLSSDEFDAISTVMGSVHWGYIPTTKLPSSQRGKTTHERLCQHENIARTTKECCSVPALLVKSSVPGEVLQRVVEHGPDNHGSPQDVGATVADVAGELCDDFEEWALEHYLNDIKDDWGWFELTSQAYS